MNILHLVATVGNDSGGLGPVALGLTAEQLAAGHEVAIWCQMMTSQDRQAESVARVGSAIASYPVFGPTTIGYSCTAERWATSQAARDYEILHQHGIWMANSRVTNRWRDTTGRPTVIAPHGTLEIHALQRSVWKKRLAAWAYETRNLHRATCIHATAPAEAHSIRSFGLYQPIAVIPNGVPDTWLDSRGDHLRFKRHFDIRPETRLLLFLSRLHPMKGLPLLLEAMERLRSKLVGWQLIIVGADENGYQQQLESLAHRLGVADFIRFLGPLYDTEKRDAYAAADLFVLPTLSENFALVVAEALGAGVPVLTTRSAPWEELESHKAGWWVDANSYAITEALQDATRRSKDELIAMGERGKKLIIRKYTWKQAAEKTLLVYDWLLGHGGCPDFVILD